MKNLVVIFTLILVSSSFYIKQNTFPTDKSIYSNWLVYKYQAGTITELSNKEAKKFLGKNISISKNELNIYGEKYRNCELFVEEVDIEEYFDSFRFDYNKLGLKVKKAKLYSYVCQDDEGEEFLNFLYFGDFVIYNSGGFFFYLK